MKVIAIYLLFGSLQTGLYLKSIKPEQTVPYLSLFTIPFMLLIPDVLSVENFAGMSVKRLSILFAILCGAFAYGTLA